MQPQPRTAAQLPEEGLSVGYLIGRARTALLRSLDAELEPFGLTGVQFAVLKRLVEGTAATAADLCRAMHYDTGSMTRILDRLEEKALIRRERCREDRRVVFLKVTSAGRSVLPKLRAPAQRALDRHLAGFSRSEIDSLKRYLHRMIDNESSESSESSMETQE